MQQLLVRLAIAFLLVFYSVLARGQEILRPTADADSSAATIGCTGTNDASGSMANSRDTSQLTYDTLSATSDGSGGEVPDPGIHWSGRAFTTWASASGSYSGLTISVMGACYTSANAIFGACKAVYSLNGGSTWTSFGTFTPNSGMQTKTITIAPGTTISNLRVSACVQATFGTENTTTSFNIYDIWTSGTLSGGGSTPQPPLMFQQQ